MWGNVPEPGNAGVGQATARRHWEGRAESQARGARWKVKKGSGRSVNQVVGPEGTRNSTHPITRSRQQCARGNQRRRQAAINAGGSVRIAVRRDVSGSGVLRQSLGAVRGQQNVRQRA